MARLRANHSWWLDRWSIREAPTHEPPTYRRTNRISASLTSTVPVWSHRGRLWGSKSFGSVQQAIFSANLVSGKLTGLVLWHFSILGDDQNTEIQDCWNWAPVQNVVNFKQSGQIHFFSLSTRIFRRKFSGWLSFSLKRFQWSISLWEKDAELTSYELLRMWGNKTWLISRISRRDLIWNGPTYNFIIIDISNFEDAFSFLDRYGES